MQLIEIVKSQGPNEKNRGLHDIFLVFEYLDHDLAGLLRIARLSSSNQTSSGSSVASPSPQKPAVSTPSFRLTNDLIQVYMYQLLAGVAYMHSKNWVHRDLKTANLLVSSDNLLKIADFGLARSMDSGNFTPKTVTLWYRAPEILFQDKSTNVSSDLWSVGCIFGELITGSPLFKGNDSVTQMMEIYKLCGVPNLSDWPNLASNQGYILLRPKKAYNPQFKQRFSDLDPNALDLLMKLLTMNHHHRITASDALQHPYFESIRTFLAASPTNHITQLVPRIELSKSAHDFEAQQDILAQEQRATMERKAAASAAAAASHPSLAATASEAAAFSKGTLAHFGSVDAHPLSSASRSMSNDDASITSRASSASVRGAGGTVLTFSGPGASKRSHDSLALDDALDLDDASSKRSKVSDISTASLSNFPSFAGNSAQQQQQRSAPKQTGLPASVRPTTGVANLLKKAKKG
jgi:serine/threonine protein kinase